MMRMLSNANERCFFVELEIIRSSFLTCSKAAWFSLERSEREPAAKGQEQAQSGLQGGNPAFGCFYFPLPACLMNQMNNWSSRGRRRRGVPKQKDTPLHELLAHLARTLRG